MRTQTRASCVQLQTILMVEKKVMTTHVVEPMPSAVPAPPAALVLKHVLPTVVFAAQLVVRQHLVGLGDLLELLLRLLLVIHVFVRMVEDG
mmetsp:Transcript_5137/g.10362  ORF Transcript_5137/g.10362 Transcript_5137/m.10362 type:complete len:91 (-) Transcript_5137:1611-1883(-)